jgi:hypothetical protein
MAASGENLMSVDSGERLVFHICSGCRDEAKGVGLLMSVDPITKSTCSARCMIFLHDGRDLPVLGWTGTAWQDCDGSHLTRWTGF